MNATPTPRTASHGLTTQVEKTAEILFEAQADVESGLEAAREALGPARFAKVFMIDEEARGVARSLQ